jgi:regulator of RNase E activity RraA
VAPEALAEGGGGFGGTTTTVRCFEDNALAKFVLEGDGKGQVRWSTTAAPATPILIVDLIARIADVREG